MATTTPKLGLRKPAGTDLVNVLTDIDASMDILDNAVMLNVNNRITSSDNRLGIHSDGAATGSNLLVSAGSDGQVYLIAESSFAAANLRLRYKSAGSGSVIVESETGAFTAQFVQQGSPFLSASFWSGVHGAARFLELGAVDSGGTGYRVVRVAN